jgi:hypothetical protein
MVLMSQIRLQRITGHKKEEGSLEAKAYLRLLVCSTANSNHVQTTPNPQCLSFHGRMQIF